MVRGRRWILCSANNGVNVVMYRPIFEHLRRDPRLRVFHTAKLTRTRQIDRDDREDLQSFFHKQGIGRGVIRPNVTRYIPFHLYLSPNFANRCMPRFARVRVQIFHGVSFKNCAVSEKTFDFDRLFLPGPYHRRRFLERELYREGDQKLRMVGVPKLDRLRDGSLKRDEILASLNLDPSRKTVLYAPTGDPGNSLNRQGEAIISALLTLPVNLIVKPHDHASRDPKCTIDWRTRLREWKHERMHVDFSSDVVPLMAAADMLISDASSVAFEYTLVDRPIVFIDVPEILERRAEQALDLETWGRKGGEVVKDAKELLEVVPRLLERPEEKGEIRRAIADDVFFQPGTASARAARTLYELLELDPPEELRAVAGAAAG